MWPAPASGRSSGQVLKRRTLALACMQPRGGCAAGRVLHCSRAMVEHDAGPEMPESSQCIAGGILTRRGVRLGDGASTMYTPPNRLQTHRRNPPAKGRDLARTRRLHKGVSAPRPHTRRHEPLEDAWNRALTGIDAIGGGRGGGGGAAPPKRRAARVIQPPRWRPPPLPLPTSVSAAHPAPPPAAAAPGPRPILLVPPSRACRSSHGQRREVKTPSARQSFAAILGCWRGAVGRRQRAAAPRPPRVPAAERVRPEGQRGAGRPGGG